MKAITMRQRLALVSRAFMLLILLMPFVDLSAWNHLSVSDPRTSWRTYQGTITEADLRVEPKGLYMDYELTLSFSSQGTPWTSVSDTTEVVLNFDLPRGAVVYDSWLWIEGEAVQAELLDKWTASMIYEGIVKRRRDPSILVKQSTTQYELRIFPMAGNEERKVKICYMLPARWGRSHALAELPLDILRQSAWWPSLRLEVIARDPWQDPFIYQDELKLEEQESQRYTLELEPGAYENRIDLGFPTPVNENGLFLSAFQGEEEGIYELAFFPGLLLDTIVGRNVAVMFDYDVKNFSGGGEDAYYGLMYQLMNTLSSRDSFNLIVSSLDTRRFSDRWIPATQENISQAFMEMESHWASYSNLQGLLAEGIEFVQGQASGGELVLISNSDQYDSFTASNGLIEDILELMGTPISVHIGDYQNTEFSTFWSGGQYFHGNGYLYTNLAKQTGGTLQRSLNGLDLEEVLEGVMKYAGGYINSMDLYTGLADGFCHSRYHIGGTEAMVYLHDPIIQIGKYRGSFPLHLEFYGEFEGEIISKMLQIEESSLVDLDSMAAKAWTSRFIEELEAGARTNDAIGEIIYQSLEERVLSEYTAFLCIEPNMIIDPGDPDDPEGPVSPLYVEKEEADEDMPISVYPNPFMDQLSIELECPDPGLVKELAIYNLNGQLVFRFDPESCLVAGKNILTWEGTNGNGAVVDAGVYLLVYQDEGGRKTVKLVKQ